MDCYKEFANIYDSLIQEDINYELWGSAILDLCNNFKVDNHDYLDLGCGTGNLTAIISDKFASTYAVDLSPEMLTEAENKFRSLGKKAKFICQDITGLKLNKKFDLITCCLDSTNYILEETKLRDYFNGVKNHLKDKGVFIFDINSYYKLTEILGDNIFYLDNDEIYYVWQNALEGDIVTMNLTFFIKEGELYRRIDEEHRERAYNENQIEDILDDVGFTILKKLDNYEEESLKSTTERITYVAAKRI